MKVTLAYPYTTGDGKTHKADKTLDLDKAEARRLLNAGLARNPQPRRGASGTDKED